MYVCSENSIVIVVLGMNGSFSFGGEAKNQKTFLNLRFLFEFSKTNILFLYVVYLEGGKFFLVGLVCNLNPPKLESIFFFFFFFSFSFLFFGGGGNLIFCLFTRERKSIRGFSAAVWSRRESFCVCVSQVG